MSTAETLEEEDLNRFSSDLELSAETDENSMLYTHHNYYKK